MDDEEEEEEKEVLEEKVVLEEEEEKNEEDRTWAEAGQRKICGQNPDESRMERRRAKLFRIGGGGKR